ncbi:T9SS type A sorting domain-containing protein [Flavobacterium sp. FlaQc-48]|uniref:T9SS type A sorting domain-containing protein n=1 Tax=Flavobacterium sp. FlaQc-48 TaxID=3374181 RepID=UPI003757B574
MQPDGKIIIGGNFTSYQGNVQRNLIRLNSDGSKDKSFEIKSRFNGEIRTIVLQPDGKIIAGGSFYIFQGYGSPRVIRLNTDGSDDHSFDIGSGGLLVGFNDAVSSIILQPNGQIVVGGNFTKFQNIEQSFLIRLNSNGTKDSTFDIQPGFNNNITAIYQQSDNKILVGGFFNNYKATPSSFLIRIKGTETNLSNEDFSTEKSMFSIWPNPAKNTLNIHSLNENNYSVKIYDLSGKLIYSKENLSNSIDVSSFTSGMYLIKIKAENGETSQKFIKI